MKAAGISIALVLLVGALISPIEFSQAQMPEQAQSKIPEQAKAALGNVDNFGMEISSFMHDANKLFKQQREETVAAIKECRENKKNADPSNREQVKLDCRATLDSIKEFYKETRQLFRDTFKEFKAESLILIKEARGHDISESAKQNAIDRINGLSFEKQNMGDEKGMGSEMKMKAKELRDKIKKQHDKKSDLAEAEAEAIEEAAEAEAEAIEEAAESEEVETEEQEAEEVETEEK
ncbi:MAG: hypothetical exported protein [Marine Group I thaumarchaeote]|nr:MAG: hypothetical exported protein [Marine Group I thaumarchaeote]